MQQKFYKNIFPVILKRFAPKNRIYTKPAQYSITTLAPPSISRLFTVSWISVLFCEKSTKSMGVAIPPYPNAAQVWNAAPATNRGNFKPCSLRSRAGKISSRFSFLFRHLLACALLGDPWLSRHSPQSSLLLFGDSPRTPFQHFDHSITLSFWTQWRITSPLKHYCSPCTYAYAIPRFTRNDNAPMKAVPCHSEAYCAEESHNHKSGAVHPAFILMRFLALLGITIL